MTPTDILAEFYTPGTPLFETLVTHSKLVAKKAREVALSVAHLNPDLDFIEEAAMLHDIGICLTNAPQIGCHGNHPYIWHGYLGAQLLKEKGLHRHALVCERHPGTGISAEAIRDHNLGLPERDMCPISLEEKIICFADKFYSKTPASLETEKSVDEVLDILSGYGGDQVTTFKEWLTLFGA